jgi:predicted lipoprotein with Yx(FWY)xxD motif
VGTYEFPGADGPVLIGESMVSPAFQIIGASSATQDSSSSSSGGGLYGSDNSGSSGSSSSSSTSSDAGELRVSQNADLGTFLTDGKGMTLYIFVKDAPNKSNCSGGCLQAWPPLVVNSADEVKAEDGVDASKIGTIPFSGGGLQVTYNQKPLYYWAEDMNPGDVNGQGVNNTWYVLKP